jgi:hypothetical protein
MAHRHRVTSLFQMQGGLSFIPACGFECHPNHDLVGGNPTLQFQKADCIIADSKAIVTPAHIDI